MKKEIETLAKNTVADIANKPISRKEAIKKTSLLAVSAATTMLLLNSPKAQACSPGKEDRYPDRGRKPGGGHGGGRGRG